MRDRETPFAYAWKAVVAFFFVPALVLAAYWRANQFDPYTVTFFTKQIVEQTATLPDDIRLGGWICLGIGGVLALIAVDAVRAGRLVWRDVLMTVWLGVMIAVLSGAFFLAADRAQDRIAQQEISG